VTNGARAFVLGDGNSPWARRQRDLIALHLADLGGEERLSENQLSLCRRAATLETELEMLEGQLSLGKVADLDLYNRLSGNLRRILESLGLERKSRDVTPSLSAYLAGRVRHDEGCSQEAPAGRAASQEAPSGCARAGRGGQNAS
jgi:hypothetical protein